MPRPGFLRLLLLLLVGGAIGALALGVGTGSGAGAMEWSTQDLEADASGRAAWIDRLSRDDSEGAPTVRGTIRSLATAHLIGAAGERAGVVWHGEDPPFPVLEMIAPTEAVAGRGSALVFRIVGNPGDAWSLHLTEGDGAPDSARVRLDSTGRAEVPFRVVPPRGGWRGWEGRVTGADGVVLAAGATGAWVHPERPLRLLALGGGGPSWEGRFLLRALEESGVEILSRQAVAPEMAWPEDPLRGDAWSVVLLLPDAVLTAADVALLRTRIERGAGLISLGIPGRGGGGGAPDPLTALLPGAGLLADAASPGGSGGGGAGETSSSEEEEEGDIRWTLPSELLPLPKGPADAAFASMPTEPGWWVAARVGEEAVLSLGTIGRGRVVLSGIAESWRWRMERGEGDAHRGFWRSLAEWADGGNPGPLEVGTPLEALPPGVPARLVLHATESDGDLPETVLLRSSDDGVEEALDVVRSSHGQGEVRFLPSHAGAFEIALPEGSPIGGGWIGEPPTPPGLPSIALALGDAGVARSGGEPSPRSILDRSGGDGPIRKRAAFLVFILLFSLATLEWTIRRMGGER